jgi:hypothetical protein
LRAELFRLVAFLRPPDDFRLDLRVELPVDFLRRTGLLVDNPESAPNTSEVAPAVPVSMILVVGVYASEPDKTSPMPVSSPLPDRSRIGSIDPVSSAMTPLSVEFHVPYIYGVPFIATNKQSFNETSDD